MKNKHYFKDFEKFKKEYWDFSQVLPTPNFTIYCPICGGSDIKLSHWLFHIKQNPTPTPYRCDVTFKCTCCSYIINFGVLITEEYFKPWKTKQRLIQWRTGVKILDGEFNINDLELSKIYEGSLKK